MARVLICGDRNWKDMGTIGACIDALPKNAIVIHGDARGADSIAGFCARQNGLGVTPYPADWNRHGKAAGIIRNRLMLDETNPDLVIFFHNNLKQSKGTRHMVEIAYTANIPVLNGRSVTDWNDALRFYLPGQFHDSR